MTAEEFDIKNSFGFYFNFISTQMKMKLEKHIKEYDVTIQQFGILLNVYKQGPQPQKMIVRFTNGDEPSTARVVDKLEKKGFLKRVTDTEDKRVKLVFATKKTKEILDKLLPFASEINEEIGSCLSKSEKEDLMMLLKKVASSI